VVEDTPILLAAEMWAKESRFSGISLTGMFCFYVLYNVCIGFSYRSLYGLCFMLLYHCILWLPYGVMNK